MKTPTRTLVFLGLSALASASLAGEVDLSRGAELYAQECSKCHGRTSASRGGETHRVALVRAGQVIVTESRDMLAFAMPYGPTLRGVIGRPAGTVPGFEYSKAFLNELGGKVWDAESLDVFITDSQRRAPGARMFYRQPDPDIRRSIIDYLAASP